MSSSGKCSRGRKAQANSSKPKCLRHQRAGLAAFPPAREVLELLDKAALRVYRNPEVWEGSRDAALSSCGQTAKRFKKEEE